MFDIKKSLIPEGAHEGSCILINNSGKIELNPDET
jgi:hypothetical protein